MCVKSTLLDSTTWVTCSHGEQHSRHLVKKVSLCHMHGASQEGHRACSATCSFSHVPNQEMQQWICFHAHQKWVLRAAIGGIPRTFPGLTHASRSSGAEASLLKTYQGYSLEMLTECTRKYPLLPPTHHSYSLHPHPQLYSKLGIFNTKSLFLRSIEGACSISRLEHCYSGLSLPWMNKHPGFDFILFWTLILKKKKN